jgi:TRAP-type uncharacterized transport system fused permease subunit
MMYAPRALFSMLMTLAIFAIATYIINGSLWSAFVETVLCAIILQVGYFAGVVILARREQLKRRAESKDGSVVVTAKDVGRADDLHAGSASGLNISDR